MRRRLTLLAILAATALVCFVFSRKREGEPGEQGSVRSSPAPKIGDAPAARPAPPIATAANPPPVSHDPRTQGPMLARREDLDGFSPEGQRILRNGLYTFQAIELERRRFRKHSPGAVMLQGVQRKLLVDDYRYAALLSGKDCSGEASFYTNLVQRIAQMDVAAIESGLSEP
jgi:hypothetical protein